MLAFVVALGAFCINLIHRGVGLRTLDANLCNQDKEGSREIHRFDVFAVLALIAASMPSRRTTRCRGKPCN
jgi:hypothetical protein